MSLRRGGNYDDYAFVKVVDIEKRAWADVERLRLKGASDADVERATLRAQSWTDLIHTYLKGKKMQDGVE